MDDVYLSFVQSGEVEVAARDCGGRGLAMILLHGLAAEAHASCAPTAPALTDGFHVLLIDRRDHAYGSGVPDDVSRHDPRELVHVRAHSVPDSASARFRLADTIDPEGPDVMGRGIAEAHGSDLVYTGIESNSLTRRFLGQNLAMSH